MLIPPHPIAVFHPSHPGDDLEKRRALPIRDNPPEGRTDSKSSNAGHSDQVISNSAKRFAIFSRSGTI